MIRLPLAVIALTVIALMSLNAVAGGITICHATSQGPVCEVTAIDKPPSMCLDGGTRLVPCSTIIPGYDDPKPVACRMTVEWVLLDPEHPTIAEITPVCADEADVASSSTTTKILKLGK